MTDGATERSRVQAYSGAYMAAYGFEARMVAGRRRLLLELLGSLAPRVVVEIGCGTELLSRAALAAGSTFEQWVIVEPSREFAAGARAQATGGASRIDVIEQLFELAHEQVVATCIQAPGLVICSSLLHEVADPHALLGGIRALLELGDGTAHVNVPNARSLHRQLARAMGLISDEAQLTARNELLAQQVVLDAASLAALVEAAGLTVIERGGYFVKPFTHEQMDQLPFLDARMLDGLWLLGRELPELAAEIYVNTRANA